MRFARGDRVVLSAPLPPYALRAGDLGEVVDLFSPGSIEVEFLDTDGEPYAILTLRPAQVRPATELERQLRQRPAPLPLGIEPTVANATHLGRAPESPPPEKVSASA